jgi:hypothetical protein
LAGAFGSAFARAATHHLPHHLKTRNERQQCANITPVHWAASVPLKDPAIFFMVALDLLTSDFGARSFDAEHSMIWSPSNGASPCLVMPTSAAAIASPEASGFTISGARAVVRRSWWRDLANARAVVARPGEWPPC